MSANPATPDTPAPDEATPRAAWLDWINANRQALGLGVTLVLFSLALIACYHLLRDIDAYSLHDALLDVPTTALTGAFAATVVGFIFLLGYEWSASRFAGVKLPTPALLTGGFSAFAIGNAVGLSMLSGGSVRYRLYARLGLGAGDVALMTLFASLSLGCALPVLAAVAALSDLADASLALHLPQWLVAVLALGIIAFCLLLVVGIERRRLPEQPSPDSHLVRVGRRTLRLPGLRLSLLQLLITALDVAAAATVLYLLLPEAPPFGAFLLVYLIALAAGVLSHVPGGVGVFEAVLLAAFAGQLGAAPLAAALLLYRLIYVVLPLIVACLLLLFLEARRILVAKQAVRITSGFAAQILSLLVFISGIALLPWRTVADNVGFGLELAGVPEAERKQRVGEQLELVNLTKWAGRKVNELSGGMQQRVGLARAFATGAPILLMDEPFSALDPLIRTRLQDELLEFQRRLKKTILFVSHDLDEAFRIGNRIAIM